MPNCPNGSVRPARFSADTTCLCESAHQVHTFLVHFLSNILKVLLYIRQDPGVQEIANMSAAVSFPHPFVITRNCLKFSLMRRTHRGPSPSRCRISLVLGILVGAA